MPARTPSRRKPSAPGKRLRLRDYALRDFDAMLALDQKCFVAGIAYSEDELNRYVHRRGAFTIVAEDAGGALAGFVVAQTERRFGWIVTIDIREDARRSGLGTRLMAAAEEKLREAETVAVVLEVAVNNLPAVNFYKRLGYQITRTLPRYYLGSLDAFQMLREL